MNDIYETIYNLKHKDFYNSPGFPAINNDDPIAFKDRQDNCEHDTAHAGLCTKCFLPYVYWPGV